MPDVKGCIQHSIIYVTKSLVFLVIRRIFLVLPKSFGESATNISGMQRRRSGGLPPKSTSY